MNSSSLATLTAALLALAACGSGDPTTVAEDAPVAPMVSDPDVLDAAAEDAATDEEAISLPAAAATPWREATAAYLNLKDALVASDLEQAQEYALRMEETLSAADVRAMGDTGELWMARTPELRRAATRVANADDLDDARARFAELTPVLVTGVRMLGDAGTSLYVVHCPMAFDNDGADWVSAETEIRNPYFGEAMLTCGKVTEEL